jgi:hypothetical protein
MGPAAAGGSGGWLCAAGLLGVLGVLSVGSPSVLLAAPLGLLVMALQPRRFAVLVAGVLALMVFLGGDSSSGLWYVERGWALILAGWFLALTLRWPRKAFLPRGLGAVAGTFGAAALVFMVRPGDWTVLDWAVSSRMEAGMSIALEMIRSSLGSDALSGGFEARAFEVMALQGLIFPALLGLASLAGLGVAWWMYVRLNRLPEEGLGPLRSFRFNDQLVWVLILGVLVLLGSSGLLERVGTNAVVFMGALYALRGAAVVLFLAGGVSFFGGFLLVLGFLLVAPVLLTGAAAIGLGDTWLDLRARLRKTSPS